MRSLRYHFSSIGLSALLLTGVAHSQQRARVRSPSREPITFDATRAQEVDSIFAKYDTGGSPGCAVGLYQAGAIRDSHGYGLADVGAGTPITPTSVFGLASLSKQFTAFSVFLLARDGRLSLDDDIRKWVPEVPDFGATAGRPITIRQLVHHISGIPNYLAILDSGWHITDTLTEQYVLSWLQHQHLDFTPGSRYRYSNTGYMLLAMMVKRASGLSLRDFAARRIFAPLHMTGTQFGYDQAHPIPPFANAYISRSTTIPGDQPLVAGGPVWQVANSKTSILADAGLYSTIKDLAKWDANLYTGAVGGPKVRAWMTEPAVLTSGDTIDYAGGLMIGSYRGLRTIGHIGGWSGEQTWLIRYPEQRFTIAILCNRRGFDDAHNPSHRIAEIYLGDRMAPDIEAVVSSTVASAGVDSAVGLYHGLRRRYWPLAFDPLQLNNVGYALLKRGAVADAIAIFRLNVETYPSNANVYDSLGEAYADHGDTAQAITNYARSLALDSTNANAVKMLKKLRGQRP